MIGSGSKQNERRLGLKQCWGRQLNVCWLDHGVNETNEDWDWSKVWGRQVANHNQENFNYGIK